MKSATLPSLRVDPALREAAEAVLEEGETLSSFVEQAVRLRGRATARMGTDEIMRLTRGG